ncbi:MAG: hypothetical protein ABIF85_03680 [Nanoarchaeota archaeon]
MNKSDLIIIGQKVKDGPPANIGNNMTGYPEWIDIKITRILKGDKTEQIIKANSWYDMCGYGVVLNDDEPYVIFLTKSEKSENRYTSVNQGCSAGPYNIENNMVNFEGKRMSLEEFISKFDIQSTNNSDNHTQRQNSYVYLGALVILIIALFVLKPKKK